MRRAFVLAIAACSIAACSEDRRGAEPQAEPSSRREQAYSVQLHVHGSFSEGVGSIDSHSFEASDLGLDVIWWSDHDFRIASYHHVSTFGFEGESEPIDHREPWQGEPWQRLDRRKWLSRISGSPAAEDEMEFTDEQPFEGQRSLRVRVSASSNSKRVRERLYRLRAARGVYRRPLASDVTIRLAIFPEQIDSSGRAVIKIGLSEHAPHEENGLTTYGLRYFLADAGAQPHREGTVYHVPLAYRPGEWNQVALPISEDARRGFPFLVADDNSMTSIAFGVEACCEASASVRFDDLRIEQKLAGSAAYQKEAETIGSVSERYPHLRQLQGVEISYCSQHLNEFSVATELIDYDSLLRDHREAAQGDPELRGGPVRASVARRAVEAAHARGGLVSYNHMFGVSGAGSESRADKEAIFERLLATRVYGADILEVGYRDRGGHRLEDHLWIWDQLALRGLHLIGTGVSDSHGGEPRWRTAANNFVSWIYAASPGKADLIEGMRAARIFFGDLVAFDGTMELETRQGFRMGNIVVTDRPTAEIDIRSEGLTAGDHVVLVQSGLRKETYRVTGPVFAQRVTVPLDRASPTVVRAEAYGAGGGAKAFTNPITFLREPPDDGIPSARAAIDVAGVRSLDIYGLTVLAVRPVADSAEAGVRLCGRATEGQVRLDCAPLSAPVEVRLDGISGVSAWQGKTLTLSSLRGEGCVELKSAPRSAP